MFSVFQTSLPRSIWLYLLCEAFFIYLFVSILQFSVENNQNLILAGMYLVEFGVHEVSHLVVGFLPTIWVAAAGSIGEVGFPLLVLIATLKGRSYFAASFAGLWLMLALHSVGRYVADARTQALPLVGPGEAVTHDWHYILGELGALPYDTVWGGAIVTLGTCVGAAALAWGGYLILVKAMQMSA